MMACDKALADILTRIANSTERLVKALERNDLIPDVIYSSEICCKLQETTGIPEMEMLKITLPKCFVRDYLAVPASVEHSEKIEMAFRAMEQGIWGNTSMCRIPK